MTRRHASGNDMWMTRAPPSRKPRSPPSTNTSTASTNIQFTMETEKDGSLPFLDVLLSHESDGSIRSTVYRKPTHTDRYFNVSHHPLAHKKSAITSLFSRATSLTSSPLDLPKERKHITRALKNNGYPTRFIERSATHTQASTTSDEPTNEEQKPRATVTIPYIQGLSEPIKRLLERVKVKVRLRPNKTLRQLLVRPKDKVPMEQRTGVVYSIPCRDCPKTYVGQSGRSLECRVKEHQRAVKYGDTNTSAIAEHAWQEQHNINWPVATILDSNQYLHSRLILESWHIHQQPDPMNRERGSLPPIYCSLIRNKNKKQ